MLTTYIPKIQTGKVQAFLCSDVRTTASELDQSDRNIPGETKHVTLIWDELPSHDSLLEGLLHAMANAAFNIWPEWYGGKVDFKSRGNAWLEDEMLSDFKVNELAAINPELYAPWLKSAMACCQARKAPALSERFPTTLQFKQLALVINPETLVVTLAVNDAAPQEYRLHSLSRIATWIANETNARVAVLIPETLQQHQELDLILDGAIKLPAVSHLDLATTVLEPVNVAALGQAASVNGSGKNILFNKLLKDAELGQLFCANQSVETVRGKRYLVDLLWKDRKVVVEVDGYDDHGNRIAFLEDRNRDYELLISGYIVLRIAQDEVVNDLEIAVEKIRDVVRFRRAQ